MHRAPAVLENGDGPFVVPGMHYPLEQVKVCVGRHGFKEASFLKRHPLADTGYSQLFVGAGEPLRKVEEDALYLGVSLKDGYQYGAVAPADIDRGSYAREVIGSCKGPCHAH